MTTTISSAEKRELLHQLYAPYQKCLECPLGFLGRKKIVFGEGDYNAKIMFIGEAPGKEEDDTGKPFVGRSGKILDEIFEIIGIQREDVFISNIVKCRPPKNRPPLQIETSTCKQILLLNQIKIIAPKIICTLGSTALKGLMGEKSSLAEMRGNTYKCNANLLIPTYHPAYILRNRNHFATLLKDIQTVKNASD